MMRDRGHLRDSLENKAKELFSLCDPESKGFATKADLEKLRCELPLPPEQLDIVFDALDTNADGKLTLKEFTEGFGIFLGIDTLPNKFDSQQLLTETEEDEEILEELLDHLGARNLFTDEDYLREMWRRVRKQDPVMLSNFENFISKMAADLKDSVRERSNLQTTLKNRKQDHETQVQTLYMEMEEQLKFEKEKILAEEQRKEQRLRDELETELQLKDHQLLNLLETHEKMEKQLDMLNSMDSEKKNENVKLEKDRDDLETKLSASEKLLHDMKNNLAVLRKRSIDEKRKRAQAALKISEGIALERENLVLELHHLKEINKQLQDEKDELAQSNVQMFPAQKPSSSNPKVKSTKLEARNDYAATKTKVSASQVEIKEVLEESRKENLRPRSRSDTQSHPLMDKDAGSGTEKFSSSSETSKDITPSSVISAYVEEVTLDSDIQNNLNIPPRKKIHQKYDKNSNTTRRQGINSPTSTSPRTSPPVIRKILPKKGNSEESSPTRVFKVVFVGDSGVGKTSILQRFCTNSFKSTYSATVGVDFQIKIIELEGERIVLQLWDTAGQERFRSMTQQYFRKSDGVIVVYDVTCETSFKNVRNWMHSLQEGAEDSIIVLLLGNKIDLCEKEQDRVVRTKDGAHIADEYGTLFFETSAKNGDSVGEALEGLANILKTKEDEAIEHVLRLQEEEKRRKRCC